MDKEKMSFKKILESTRGYLLVALFTVCLYSFFQNYDEITAALMNLIGILAPLFWGIAIAFVVNMPMRFLENKVFRRWRHSPVKRCVCLGLGFLFVLAVVVLVMLLIVPRFIESAEIIIVNFDSYIVSLDEWASELNANFNLSTSDIKWLETTLQSIFDYLEELLKHAIPTVLKLTVSVASMLIDILLSLILGVYALFNKERHMSQAKRMVHAVFGEEKERRILSVASRTNRALNQYFFGMILECGILGSMCFIGMSIFRFPYALLISVIVGLTQIVPVIGPWFSALLGALIMLMTEPGMALWFLVFIVIVQQIECNLVYPRVVGNMVGLGGIWVMIAILLGSGLFGLPGIILCVPVMAVIQTLVREWVDARVALKDGLNQPEETQEEAEKPVKRHPAAWLGTLRKAVKKENQ